MDYGLFSEVKGVAIGMRVGVLLRDWLIDGGMMAGRMAAVATR